jgi:paraquat-inducible protein B
VPVIVELEPDRIKKVNNQAGVSDKSMLERLIDKGLRAQLQTGSLLTGQLLVDLDFYPDTEVILSANTTPYPQFPTTASSLDQFTHAANIIMDKVAKLPLDKLSQDIDATLVSLQGTSNAATDMLHSAKGTLGHADNTISSAQQVLNTFEPGSTTHYELEQLLRELTQTAKSVKQLSDYLEQHPDSLIRGKEEE